MNFALKNAATTLTAAAMALTMSATASFSNSDDDAAKALLGIVALGVIGSAIADDQHSRGHVEYTRHPNVHAQENAIGRCMHRAKREVKSAGGYRVNLDHVKTVTQTNSGGLLVRFVATGYYDHGHRTSDVVCEVKNQKIVSFNYH